jgi:hypothetical protein
VGLLIAAPTPPAKNGEELILFPELLKNSSVQNRKPTQVELVVIRERYSSNMFPRSIIYEKG